MPRRRLDPADIPVPDALAHESLWVFSLAGLIAIGAGVVAMFLLPTRSGFRVLMIGVALALVPPVFNLIGRSVLVPVAIGTAAVGLVLLVMVAARWFERRRIQRDAAKRASYLEWFKRDGLTTKEAVKVVQHIADKNFDPTYEVKE